MKGVLIQRGTGAKVTSQLEMKYKGNVTTKRYYDITTGSTK